MKSILQASETKLKLEISEMGLKQLFLKQKQSLPLDCKIKLSLFKIKKWHDHFQGDVFVSFSGGKDSVVLLHLVRSLYKNIKAVFVNTGLEYPENIEIVKSYDNVKILYPKKKFPEIISKWGYPVISKEIAHKISFLQNPTDKNIKSRNLFLTGINSKGESCKAFKLSNKWKHLIDAPFKISAVCCDHLKKNPIKNYIKKTGYKPMTGVMACESNARTRTYVRQTCSIFNADNSICNPLSVWTEQDILQYIHENNLKISKIYGNIEKNNNKYILTGRRRTGCMFCLFGIHRDKSDLFEKNRFEQMKISHPKIYNYCINKLNIGKVLDYLGINY